MSWYALNELRDEYNARFDDVHERFAETLRDLELYDQSCYIDWEEEDHWTMTLERADNGEL